MTAIRCLSLLGILLAPPAFAAGNDELWEVGSKMGAVPGMPAGYSMPTQVHQVCIPPGKAHESAAGDPKNCKILDLKTSGTHTSYRVECTGANAMSGAMDIDFPSPQAYRGTMKVNSQGMAMTMEFSGKKVGSCTYEDPLAKMGGKPK